MMTAVVLEWLNVVVRWAHVIAAIMWIGDSFLFMWLDSHLTKELSKERDPEAVGELWMTHSGGFYEVVKLKSLKSLPKQLFWFKWESYSTWITGFLLIAVVYWGGGRAMLVEASSTLTHAEAVGISVGCLVGGFVVYDLLCRTPLITDARAMGAVGVVVVVAFAWGLLQVFSPRAVFLQTGAMLGTIMTSNVFFRIIPSQRHMIAATEAGVPVDTSYGARAKARSVHNHYLTLPVLFLMLSNHFPTLYSHAMAWGVLGLVVVAGVAVKYIMNFRSRTHPVIFVGALATLGGAAAMTMPASRPAPEAFSSTGEPPVAFAQVKTILEARCTSCHAKAPTNPAFAAPAGGVVLDTDADVVAHKDRILIRAVETKTMPLGNMTGMTDDERALVGRWIAEGAHTTR
jgi:uncharacterized membrane protein